MPRPGLLRTRRLPLAATIGVSGLLILALAVGVLQIFIPAESRSLQEAAIREVVDRSSVAARYRVEPMDGNGGNLFALDVELDTEIDPLAAGSLLTTLFEETYEVGRVDLHYTSGHLLRISAMERRPAQWAEAIVFAGGLRTSDVALAQLGPRGMAVYRADIGSTAVDPMADYEELLEAPVPEWLSLGQVHLTTPAGQWPKHTINASRELTVEERVRFRELDAELASSIAPGEKYALLVSAELGDPTALFTSRVIPAVPPSSIDPSGAIQSIDRAPAPKRNGPPHSHPQIQNGGPAAEAPAPAEVPFETEHGHSAPGPGATSDSGSGSSDSGTGAPLPTGGTTSPDTDQPAPDTRGSDDQGDFRPQVEPAPSTPTEPSTPKPVDSPANPGSGSGSQGSNGDSPTSNSGNQSDNEQRGNSGDQNSNGGNSGNQGDRRGNGSIQPNNSGNQGNNDASPSTDSAGNGSNPSNNSGNPNSNNGNSQNDQGQDDANPSTNSSNNGKPQPNNQSNQGNNGATPSNNSGNNNGKPAAPSTPAPRSDSPDTAPLRDEAEAEGDGVVRSRDDRDADTP